MQRKAAAAPPSCQLPSPPPRTLGLPRPQPRCPPSARRPRGISCQRPWSRSPSLGLSPSHSRAAESFEKNAAGREGLLRTERLCGGNCCSALSRPRPPGGAELSAANARPRARARRAGAGPGREGAGAWGGTGGLLSHPPPPLPPSRPRMGPRQAGWMARNRGPAGQGPVPTLRLAGWDLRPVSAPLQVASFWGGDTRGSRPVAKASSAQTAGTLRPVGYPLTCCVSQEAEAGVQRLEPQRLNVGRTRCGRAGGGEPCGFPILVLVSVALQIRPRSRGCVVLCTIPHHLQPATGPVAMM